MDLVKVKIETIRKTYIGIIIATIICSLVMIGAWETLIMYGSLFLTSIFDISAWLDIINVFRYAFGFFGLLVMFAPIVILIIYHNKWKNLYMYSGLPKKKKQMDEILKEEKFLMEDKYYGKVEVLNSKHYIFIKNILLRKGEEYKIKIGEKLKPDALVIEFQNKKIVIQTGLEKIALIEAAKKLKKLLEEKDEEYVCEKINIKTSFIPFIVACLNFIIFLLFINITTLPLSNTHYIIVKLFCAILGVVLCVYFNLFGLKTLKKHIRFKIATNILYLIPIVCLIGLQIAVHFVSGIYL